MHTDDNTPTEVPELDDFDPSEIDDNPIFGSGSH